MLPILIPAVVGYLTFGPASLYVGTLTPVIILLGFRLAEDQERFWHFGR
jgi:hypothetical protein